MVSIEHLGVMVAGGVGLDELVDLADRGEVSDIDLWRVSMPLVNPHRAAHGDESVRQVVIVRLVLGDGTEGWGECPTLTHPTYASEYTAGAFALLRDELVPWLLGGVGGPPIGHPMAVSAILGARLDAVLRGRGESLVDRLGSRFGRPEPTVATTAVIGLGADPEATISAVARAVEGGAVMVKVKVSPRPVDLAMIGTVRSIWPDLALAVDGNGTLDTRSVDQLEGLGLAYVEQPAPTDDLLGSAALARRLSCPVALDESVTSMAALEAALTLGAGSVVNIKPARLGGPMAAAALARAAVDAGCGVFVGGMLETAVGRATALAVAAMPFCTFPTDLGPSSRYFAEDLAQPVNADGSGRLVVPSGNGCGVTPDVGRLAQVELDHHHRSR